MSPRQADWLAFGVTFALAVPAVATAARTGRLLVCLAVLPPATLPLLWRRSFPGAALIVLAGALTAAAFAGKGVPSSVGILFGLYAAALYGSRRLRVLSGAAVAVASTFALAWLLLVHEARLAPHLTPAILGAGAAWGLGEATRTRRAHLQRLDARAARLARERDERARQAAVQERLRIIRELHDVVTHNVSVIVLQASAARSTSSSRPDRPLIALGLIESTARKTLAELRSLLGVLRPSEPAASLVSSLHAVPSLSQLDELLAPARDAGVTTTLIVHGEARELPASVEMAAYRVVQESLTNVIKHAAATTVDIHVQYARDQLSLTVTDDGRGGSHLNAVGHGLVIMRERVQLAGGFLTAGPSPDGGFRVQAQIPLESHHQPKPEQWPTEIAG